jgi:ankyrin repeat protein
MGGGASKAESQKAGNVNYKGILPEETILVESKPSGKAQVVKSEHNIEKPDKNQDLLRPSSDQGIHSSRDVNFASGLIFTEAIENNATILDPTSVFRMIKKSELSSIEELLRQLYQSQSNLFYQIHFTKGMWNSTPLMVAIQYHQNEITHFLLTLLESSDQETIKSILNAKNDKGASILLYAAIEGMTDVVRIIFSKYFPFLSPQLLFEPSTEPIYNPLYDQTMTCSSFSISIINSRREIFSLFLDHDCPINYTFPFSPAKSIQKKLMANAVNGSVNTNSNNSGTMGVTPLLLCLSFGQLPILRIILKQLKTSNKTETEQIFQAKDTEDCTFFHYLSRLSLKHPKGEEENEQENNVEIGESDEIPLNVKILKEILQFTSSHGELIDQLLDMKDINGNTALSIACDLKQVALVSTLLELGSDPSIINTKNGFTPLHYAVKKRSKEIVELLLECGCNPLVKITSSSSGTEDNNGTSTEEICQLSALEFCYKQLKPTHEISLLIEKFAKKFRKEKEPEEIPEILEKPIDFEKENDIRLENIVEQFTPLDDSILHAPQLSMKMCSSRQKSLPILEEIMRSPSNYMMESFLSDQHSPGAGNADTETDGIVLEDSHEKEDAEDEKKSSANSKTDLKTNDIIAPEESNSSNPETTNSPIQNYLNLQFEGVKPEKKEDPKKDDETFEQFIETLLVGNNEEGAKEIIQLAENMSAKVSSPSRKESISPKKPNPPKEARKASFVTNNQFQGKRKSSVNPNNPSSAAANNQITGTNSTKGSPRKSVSIKLPPSNADSVDPSSQDNTPKEVTKKKSFSLASPRSKKNISVDNEKEKEKEIVANPYHQQTLVRPVRKGSLLKQSSKQFTSTTNDISNESTSTKFTPKPPKERKESQSAGKESSNRLAEVLNLNETASPSVKKTYNLIEKINRLTSDNADDGKDDDSESPLELTNLVVRTRPTMATKDSETNERTVRIQR